MSREQDELDEVGDELESLEQQINEQAQARESELKDIRIVLEQLEESQNKLLENLEQQIGETPWFERAMKRSPTGRR